MLSIIAGHKVTVTTIHTDTHTVRVTSQSNTNGTGRDAKNINVVINAFFCFVLFVMMMNCAKVGVCCRVLA